MGARNEFDERTGSRLGGRIVRDRATVLVCGCMLCSCMHTCVCVVCVCVCMYLWLHVCVAGRGGDQDSKVARGPPHGWECLGWAMFFTSIWRADVLAQSRGSTGCEAFGS